MLDSRDILWSDFFTPFFSPSRIDKPIVNSVIDQLYENVIAKLPWTDLSNLKLRLQSNGLKPSNSNQHNVSVQLQVKYRYPMATPSTN